MWVKTDEVFQNSINKIHNVVPIMSLNTLLLGKVNQSRDKSARRLTQVNTGQWLLVARSGQLGEVDEDFKEFQPRLGQQRYLAIVLVLQPCKCCL